MIQSRNKAKFRIVCALQLMLACGNVQAHIPLTEKIIGDALSEIEDARSVAACDNDACAAALYEFAVHATGLMELLNQEVRMHGLEQQALLEAAVASAAALGIEIKWSEAHERYFYTGEAYLRYLELVPEGLDAANSRFHLIETGFYLGDAADVVALRERAALARDYLRLYPDTANAARVAMFLAIDYRDLWRICRASDDSACVTRTAERLREHLNATAARYRDGKTGEMAGALLARFEAEAADADQVDGSPAVTP